jgi:sugar phosphate isomerase/epimerase
LCSISFRKHTPEEILRAMKDAGLSVIEWGSDVHCPPEKAEALARLQKQYSVACCSYGTYFRLGVTPICELGQYIKAAKALGTDVLRLWCGNKNSEDYTESEKKALFSACKASAEIAGEEGVTLCMECHNNTYTNTKESALELMQAVNAPAFRMYWQPSQFRSEEENIEYANLIAKHTVNIHVFNWKGTEKFPLQEAVEIWREYMKAFDGSHTLLLEFMPDNRIESLGAEASALREIAQ